MAAMKKKHKLSDPTAALEAISQPTAKLALEAAKRPRKRPRKRNSKELTMVLRKYILEFSIRLPNKPYAWQQTLAQMLRQTQETTLDW